MRFRQRLCSFAYWTLSKKYIFFRSLCLRHGHDKVSSDFELFFMGTSVAGQAICSQILQNLFKVRDKPMDASSKENQTGRKTRRSCFRGQLKRFFCKDEDGATAIEFAMIGAPFIGCIGLALFMGYLFVTNTSLDNSVSEVGRLIRVGKIEANNVSRADFRRMICDRLAYNRQNCNANLVIDVDSHPDFNRLNTNPPFNNGALDPGRSRYNPGNGSDYVILSAFLPVSEFTDLFSLLGSKSSASQRFMLSSSTVFRNEPF